MPQLVQVDSTTWKITGLGRDELFIGNVLNSLETEGHIEHVRHHGFHKYSLNFPGTRDGLITVDGPNKIITIPFVGYDVQITCHDPDGQNPDGRAEYNLIMHDEPTADGNGEYWQELDIESTGLTWQRVAPLSELFDQAACWAKWGDKPDIGTGDFTITDTQILSPAGEILKERKAHHIRTLVARADKPNPPRIKYLGPNTNPKSKFYGFEITRKSLSRDAVTILRREIEDARGDKAQVEDIKIENGKIRFKLPKAWIESRHKIKDYPLKHVCGVDPAYSELMENWDTEDLGSDGVWGDYDIYTNHGSGGTNFNKGDLLELIYSNENNGYESDHGVRTDWGASYSAGYTVNDVIGDDTYLYIAREYTTYPLVIVNRSTLGMAAQMTGTAAMKSVSCNSTHYFGGSANGYIYRYLISTLSYVDASASLGSAINALFWDGTYLYAGTAGGYVYQIDASDMSTVDSYNTPSSTPVNCLYSDGSYVYAGCDDNVVYKIDVSDMSYDDESSDLGYDVLSLTGDGTYLYAGTETSSGANLYKIAISDMSTSTSTLLSGGAVDAVFYDSDNTLLYATNALYYVFKIDPSDLSTIGSWDNDTARSYGIWADGEDVYCGYSTYVHRILARQLHTSGYDPDARHLNIHEAEAGGATHLRWFVHCDDVTGLIQTYRDDVSDSAHFYIVGVWENIEFTETWSDFHSGTDGVWTEVTLANGASCVHHYGLWNYESATHGSATFGARNTSSSLERKVLWHESEGGGTSIVDFLVKADADKKIDIYMEQGSGGSQYSGDLGYFDIGLDFVEGWGLVQMSASGWYLWDISAKMDEDGRVVDVLLLNKETGTEIDLGARAGDDTTTARYLSEHEAEDDGGATGELTGFTMSATSNANGEIYTYNTVSGGGWVSITGYFKPAAAGYHYTKTGTAKARIEQSYTKTGTAKARIEQSYTKTGTAKGRVALYAVKTGTALARIQKAYTKTAGSVVARIEKSYTKTAGSVVARIEKSYTKTAGSVVARILHAYTKTAGSVVARIQRSYTKTGTAKASIWSQSPTKTGTALARMLRNYTKTGTAKARIEQSYTKTGTAKGFIVNSYTKTAGSVVARILKSSTKTGTAKGSIWSQSPTKTATAKARMSQNYTKTGTSLARILKPQTKTGTAKAAIEGGALKTGTALARILRNFTKTGTSVARILKSYTKTGTAKAKISIYAVKTGTAKAAIWTAHQTKTGTALARVLKSFTKTSTSLARVLKSVTKTGTALAAIWSASQTKTSTALARIKAPFTKTGTAKAYMEVSGHKTKTGTTKAAIWGQSVTKTGKVYTRITKPQTRTSTAKGYIASAGHSVKSGTAKAFILNDMNFGDSFGLADTPAITVYIDVSESLAIADSPGLATAFAFTEQLGITESPDQTRTSVLSDSGTGVDWIYPHGIAYQIQIYMKSDYNIDIYFSMYDVDIYTSMYNVEISIGDYP